MKKLLTLLILTTIPIAACKENNTNSTEAPQPKPDPERYSQLKKQLAEKRKQLAKQYRLANTTAKKNAILAQSRLVLENHLLEMSQCWLGTPWDFNGTTQTPGTGEIACGYFVSTLLRDAGFNLQRIKLAQQPSQRIIATFLPRSAMHIRAGIDYDSYLNQEIKRGPGWRIVGLDNHVGFLVVNEDKTTRFIHANPGTPRTVVNEARSQSAYLRNSNYRVTGNITAHKPFLTGWLTGKYWKTKLQ